MSLIDTKPTAFQAPKDPDGLNRWPLAQAIAAAQLLEAAIGKFCERIAIAGLTHGAGIHDARPGGRPPRLRVRQGGQKAAGITGMGNLGVGAVGALGKMIPKGSGGGGNPNDPGLDTSGQQDLSGNRGGAADLSGGQGGGGSISDSTMSPPPNAPTDETDWASFGGDV